jgi:hypothetical protein
MDFHRCVHWSRPAIAGSVVLGKMNVAEDQSESPVDATNKEPRNCNAGQV